MNSKRAQPLRFFPNLGKIVSKFPNFWKSSRSDPFHLLFLTGSSALGTPFAELLCRDVHTREIHLRSSEVYL